MGDRTDAIIRFPVSSMDKELKQEAVRIICEGMGWSSLDEVSLKELRLEEVSEGASEVVDPLCKAGIPFHVQWGTGDEYDAGCTVSNGNEERHVRWDRHAGGILLKLDSYKEDIDNAKKFLAMKKGLGL